MGICDVLYRWPIQAWRDLQAIGEKRFGHFGIANCLFMEGAMTELRNNTITIKEGWQGKFVGAMLMLYHPEYHSHYLIDMRSVKNGDLLPRDTDEPVEFDL
jgi:hypothetical protein